MKSCIVISDSFKGSLSSAEICAIASQTIPAFFPDCHVTAIPVADGGEGTVDCFLAALPGERRTAVVQGPFGEPVEAAYALIGEDAVVEMAAAAGLPLAGSRLDPTAASTYGVGQLIADAVGRGARRILLGLGGSATNDGGCGAAAALGAEFYDETGARLIPAGVPLVALVGCIDDSAEAAYSLGVTAMFSIDRTARSFSETRSRSAQDYRAALCDILRLIRTYERR